MVGMQRLDINAVRCADFARSRCIARSPDNGMYQNTPLLIDQLTTCVDAYILAEGRQYDDDYNEHPARPYEVDV